MPSSQTTLMSLYLAHRMCSECKLLTDLAVCVANEIIYSVPGDSKDHQVIVYNQESICELGFWQEDFILIALLVGGDYFVSKPCQ